MRMTARTHAFRLTAWAVPVLLLAGIWPCNAADMALGEYLSAQCVGCHQLSGKVSGGIPRISGLPENIFTSALNAYKTGQRDNPVMRNIAEHLKEDEISALAAFFAAQKQ